MGPSGTRGDLMNPLILSPDHFRKLAADVVALTAGYLSTLDARRVFPPTSGAETERLFAENAPELGLGNGALEGLADVIAHSRAQNGRFFGYVQGSADPVAALGDLVASILNPNITAWRSSPAGVTIERTVVGWLAEAIGCTSFSGTLTGGGSEKLVQPIASANQPTTVRSIVTPAGDERQAVIFGFRIDATRSPSAATGSAEP